MGLGTTGWGFSKTDGVPVGLVESQWGRLSMGMLQGVANACLPVIDHPLCEVFQIHWSIMEVRPLSGHKWIRLNCKNSTLSTWNPRQSIHYLHQQSCKNLFRVSFAYFSARIRYGHIIYNQFPPFFILK